MPFRRRVLSVCALGVTSCVSGCTSARAKPKSVDVLLRNEDARAEWQLAVAVEDEASEEVFRTEETIPPNDKGELGEVLIEDAFMGMSGDRFTVQA